MFCSFLIYDCYRVRFPVTRHSHTEYDWSVYCFAFYLIWYEDVIEFEDPIDICVEIVAWKFRLIALVLSEASRCSEIFLTIYSLLWKNNIYRKINSTYTCPKNLHCFHSLSLSLSQQIFMIIGQTNKILDRTKMIQQCFYNTRMMLIKANQDGTRVLSELQKCRFDIRVIVVNINR